MNKVSIKKSLFWGEENWTERTTAYWANGKHWNYLIIDPEPKRHIPGKTIGKGFEARQTVKTIQPTGVEIKIFRSVTRLHSRMSWAPNLELAIAYCNMLENYRNSRDVGK